jgi:hypothetical protein
MEDKNSSGAKPNALSGIASVAGTFAMLAVAIGVSPAGRNAIFGAIGTDVISSRTVVSAKEQKDIVTMITGNQTFPLPAKSITTFMDHKSRLRLGSFSFDSEIDAVAYRTVICTFGNGGGILYGYAQVQGGTFAPFAARQTREMALSGVQRGEIMQNECAKAGFKLG